VACAGLCGNNIIFRNEKTKLFYYFWCKAFKESLFQIDPNFTTGSGRSSFAGRGIWPPLGRVEVMSDLPLVLVEEPQGF
jgi:hypothetical protein